LKENKQNNEDNKQDSFNSWNTMHNDNFRLRREKGARKLSHSHRGTSGKASPEYESSSVPMGKPGWKSCPEGTPS
ncbi:MAG: hypothetical protein LBF22_06295, partial [Deltaproteobacteria bacterium]|nr:hypothetical protein [Deltaproteobacteria bacterium]